jgi:hypothetical protein
MLIWSDANRDADARQAPQESAQGRRGPGRGRGGPEQLASFNVHLLPHSYAVFAAEK